jgi:HAD superfamily phosphoserine phosphatase-like hydrolase
MHSDANSNADRQRAQPILGVVAFDLDGTLLRGPTVCEVLAEGLGRLERMKVLETLQQRDEVVAARLEMAGWYLQHGIDALKPMFERVRWAPGVHQAVSELRAHGIEVVIASLTWSFAVGWAAEHLGIRHFLGTELPGRYEIVHVWGSDKGRWLASLTETLRVPSDRVAAAGDTQSDIHLLERAALRFFVGNEQPPRLESVIHLPGADIRSIAQHILRDWKTIPRSNDVSNQKL